MDWQAEVEVSRCHDPGRGGDIGGGLKLCHMPRQMDTVTLTIHDVALTSMPESTRSIVNWLSASASDGSCHRCYVEVKTTLGQRLDTASDIVSRHLCPLFLGLERLHCLGLLPD